MGADEVVLNVVFYAVALLAAVCALGVAASGNIVRSCFALLGVLVGAAGIYLIAYADFLFAVQVLIYIGGILVLVIFAVMLTHRISDLRLSNASEHSFGAFLGVACLFAALVTVILSTNWTNYEEYKARHREQVDAWWNPDEHPDVSVAAEPLPYLAPRTAPVAREIGLNLRDGYLLPFEVVGVLLTVAIVGASFLARKEVK